MVWIQQNNQLDTAISYGSPPKKNELCETGALMQVLLQGKDAIVYIPTVENLTTQGVLLPILSNILALQYLVTSCVTWKYPNAPPPLAWTTLSGIRSRSKWLISSKNWTSCSRIGPLGPTVMVLVLVSTGTPYPVVRASGTFWMKLCHYLHFRHPTDGQLLHSDIIIRHNQ